MRLALAILVALAAPARAFPTGTQFDLDALAYDGAGHIAFDGAPRFANHDCSVCHTNAPGQIGVALQADPPDLFTTGWKAGQQYHMRVVLLGEHESAQWLASGDNCGLAVTPYHPCAQAGFSLEIDDAFGTPATGYVPVVNNACATAGMKLPTDLDARVLADGTAVQHNGAHHAMTSWDFCWTAPAAGAGVLTAYVAVVDGNGGDGTMNFPADTAGDDVAVGQVPMLEAGAGAPPPQTGGCAAGGESLGGGALIVAALAWIARGRRRLATLAAVAALGGCVHVRPRERETLAKRNMKFSPDPVEDELDLHMQEAREGASGGYGSSGGGCGCN